MNAGELVRLGSLRDVAHFREHLDTLALAIPCDPELACGADSPLAQPLVRHGITIGNRLTVHPMEGWDGTVDGNPSENTIRRWRRFGRSGAKLIWGGEAVAVRHEGRANPNQLVIGPHTERGLAHLREALIEEHRAVAGSDDGLLIGLQLTHSGRYSRPDAGNRAAPRILYRHPILDHRLGLPMEFPVLKDAEIGAIIEDFHRAAQIAARLGFDFVDVKHCHGYLGHEFLSAHCFRPRGCMASRTVTKSRHNRAACRGYDEVLGFELGRMFAPNGEIFSETALRGLMEIPELKGIKHSSLDRLTELERLALRDAVRSDLRIYTGN